MFGSYVFYRDPPNDAQYPSVEFKLNGQASLVSMIEAFESFLRACGYSFDGTLDIVDIDE